MKETGSLAMYRAITLLIVASPCALILSVPTAALSGLARAARAGILIKGGARLEDLSRVKALVVDKTGTLTTGEMVLHKVCPLRGFTEAEALAAAGALEQSASHPLARAVLACAKERRIAVPAASEVRNVPGVGIHGKLNGEPVFVGRPGAPLYEVPPADGEALRAGAGELRAAGFSVAAVHHGGRLGLLAFRDTTRPEAAAMVRELRRVGLKEVRMLTGDSEEVALAVSKEVGLDGHHAGLLPEEKVAAIRALAAAGVPVAMVGDGVNDAPALKAATVGIAMGAIGSNAAMEAADVILLKDDISKLPFLFALARAARRTMLFNITFASLVIVVLASATVFRGVPLSQAVIGHEGSTLLVVASSLRLLFFRGPRSPATTPAARR
jgi:Cd2+/Zn2+-exporting ATPase